MADNGKPAATLLSGQDKLARPVQSKQGGWLLLSLVVLILTYPLLDHERLVSRLILGAMTFLPLILATLKLSHKRMRLWLFVVPLAAAGAFLIAGTILASHVLIAIHWGLLAVLFGWVVLDLFAYLRHAAAITADHLLTAASVYLLLASMWFTLYELVDTIQPNSFQQTVAGTALPHADLLYFSLVTLTTVGYGDIVPVWGEVRMLAALEAVVGVLYAAITVGILVSAFKRNAK